jgi:4-hydroxythreonine-4-phosphate dehydrogenase
VICAPLALTLGDPAGVGPELCLKAWRALRDEDACFVVHGDPAPLMAAAQMLDLPRPEQVKDADEARRVFSNFLPVIALEASETQAEAAVRSIEAAVNAVRAGEASAIVTNPVSKARLYDIGFKFPGHTEFIAHLTEDLPMHGARGPVMMLSGGGLRTALVSIHIPLLTAIQTLTSDAVIHTAHVVLDALKRDFALAEPRLALAGLNPHAGENGALGREEIDILAPALDQLRADGVDIVGPLPPDTMFHEEARAGYDAAICLYHDQGLIPVKTLDFHGGVNITLGLPVIRTSPDHGTAFDIAGQGVARPDSLIAALRQANLMTRNREAAS